MTGGINITTTTTTLNEGEPTKMCSSKHGLVFVNFIFLVVALVLLIIGVIIQCSLNGSYGLINGYFVTPAALILAFGALLLFKSLFALFGVYRRSRCLVSVYAWALTVLIIVELSVGIAGLVVKSHVLRLLADYMSSAESQYTHDPFVNATWDSVQRDFKCCGVDNYTEWFQYVGNSSLPDSCCSHYAVGCGNDVLPSGNFRHTGCADVISKWTHKHEIPAAILFTFIIIFQLLSVLCARGYQRIIHTYKSVDII